MITRFQSTRTGLHMNRTEKPGSHAATCGLGTHPIFPSGQMVTGMTAPVELSQAHTVVLFAKDFPS